jgi:hypothetical protein
MNVAGLVPVLSLLVGTPYSMSLMLLPDNAQLELQRNAHVPVSFPLFRAIALALPTSCSRSQVCRTSYISLACRTFSGFFLLR